MTQKAKRKGNSRKNNKDTHKPQVKPSNNVDSEQENKPEINQPQEQPAYSKAVAESFGEYSTHFLDPVLGFERLCRVAKLVMPLSLYLIWRGYMDSQRENPGEYPNPTSGYMTNQELAEYLQKNIKTVEYNLIRMRQAGLVITRHTFVSERCVVEKDFSPLNRLMSEYMAWEESKAYIPANVENLRLEVNDKEMCGKLLRFENYRRVLEKKKAGPKLKRLYPENPLYQAQLMETLFPPEDEEVVRAREAEERATEKFVCETFYRAGIFRRKSELSQEQEPAAQQEIVAKEQPSSEPEAPIFTMDGRPAYKLDSYIGALMALKQGAKDPGSIPSTPEPVERELEARQPELTEPEAEARQPELTEPEAETRTELPESVELEVEAEVRQQEPEVEVERPEPAKPEVEAEANQLELAEKEPESNQLESEVCLPEWSGMEDLEANQPDQEMENRASEQEVEEYDQHEVQWQADQEQPDEDEDQWQISQEAKNQILEKFEELARTASEEEAMLWLRTQDVSWMQTEDWDRILPRETPQKTVQAGDEQIAKPANEHRTIAADDSEAQERLAEGQGQEFIESAAPQNVKRSTLDDYILQLLEERKEDYEAALNYERWREELYGVFGKYHVDRHLRKYVVREARIIRALQAGVEYYARIHPRVDLKEDTYARQSENQKKFKWGLSETVDEEELGARVWDLLTYKVEIYANMMDWIECIDKLDSHFGIEEVNAALLKNSSPEELAALHVFLIDGNEKPIKICPLYRGY